MSNRFKGIYRSDTLRLKKWDYSWQGNYFITLCTKDRLHYFGEVRDQKVCLSTLGEIVRKEWLRTPDLRPGMNIILDEFVIMPDHFHGILEIGRNQYNSEPVCLLVDGETTKAEDRIITGKEFGPQRKNLSSIIRGFKSAVKMEAIRQGQTFVWQRNYNEHIVRSEEDLIRIREYIRRNPVNWEK